MYCWSLEVGRTSTVLQVGSPTPRDLVGLDSKLDITEKEPQANELTKLQSTGDALQANHPSPLDDGRCDRDILLASKQEKISHLECQDLSVAPSPVVITGEASKRARSVLSHGVPQPTQGLLLSIHSKSQTRPI